MSRDDQWRASLDHYLTTEPPERYPDTPPDDEPDDPMLITVATGICWRCDQHADCAVIPVATVGAKVDGAAMFCADCIADAAGALGVTG